MKVGARVCAPIVYAGYNRNHKSCIDRLLRLNLSGLPPMACLSQSFSPSSIHLPSKSASVSIARCKTSDRKDVPAAIRNGAPNKNPPYDPKKRHAQP